MLARKLQEEENFKSSKATTKLRNLTEPSAAVGGIDNEAHRAHHKSSPPNFGGTSAGISYGSPQTGGNLVDIMGEQMAQQIQEDEMVSELFDIYIAV